MTRYAIGDIHGGAITFKALLDRINLRHEDRLYLLGDYVDRGADSKGVLDIILELMAGGYDVRPIRGNHDDMFLQSVNGCNLKTSLDYLECWGLHTLESFDVSFACDVPEQYSKLLESMPLIRVEDDYVFVHAGLDMTKDDPISQTSEQVMLWIENETVDTGKLCGRSLVVGHRIHSLDDIRISLGTKYIHLDNGAFSNLQPDYGNLVALNLDTKELMLQPWLDGEAEE
jgi:serine/threonine protein phosphatase 1